MMHIFVINLERSVERRRGIQSRILELGLDAEIFPAVDGRTLSEAESGYDGLRRRLFYGKDMTTGEIGCARSHLAVCEEIVRRDLNYALVLEDDAVLTDELPAALVALEACEGKWDLVRFLNKDKDLRRMRPVSVLPGGFTLCRLFGTPGGAYGYVVSRRAAERLVRTGRVMWMPIDTHQGQTWKHGLRVRALTPPPVRFDNEVPSTIGDERFDKFRRLKGWERAAFPLTRAGFKLADAIAKHGTFWLGRLKDCLARKR